MKKLLTLLIICSALQVRAQSNYTDTSYYRNRAYTLPIITRYDNFKSLTVIDSTHTDTVFTAKIGAVLLTDTTLKIDNFLYKIIGQGDVVSDSNNQYWQILTLDHNIVATLRRYPNYALMNIIIQPYAGISLCYYIR